MRNVRIPLALMKEYPSLERAIERIHITSYPETVFNLKSRGLGSFDMVPEAKVRCYNIKPGDYGSTSASPAKVNVAVHLDTQPPVLLFALYYTPDAVR